MPLIKIKTPFDSTLTLKWEEGKVTAKGNRESLLYWNLMVSGGLYGPYGHILNLSNCFLADLVIAISGKVDYEDYEINKEAERQVKREIEREKNNPIPHGATT